MIRRLLVANRGEVARRVVATCRLIGIETVAVYSDADATLPHVSEADRAVHLPGNAPTATYLRRDLIVAAARKTGADTVHPGWGLLATDAQLAADVVAAGLRWVGAPPEVLAQLQDKPGTAARLAAAGIHTLPQSVDAARVETFPVLVKPTRASAGRGIRLARNADELPHAIANARREIPLDGTVYFERHLPDARHLDVPVFVDRHGNAVPFAERECSVQRRRQQLVAETPSPVVTPQLREQLCDTAIAVARVVGLVGAGTVQMLVGADGGTFVLGVDAQLSGEHAVTECATGTDLVRLQLLVAEGAPLPLPGPPPVRGFAVGVRLRAEEPANAWRPAAGRLHRFRPDGVTGQCRPLPSPGLRLDAAVQTGSVVTTYYDTTVGTLVAWAPSRYEAARMLAASLTRTAIHGVATNRDLLVRVLRSTTFLSGKTSTSFLDDHPEVFAPLPSSVDAVRLSCLAAALAAAAARRAHAKVLASVPSGWRNVPSGCQTAVFDGPAGTVEIGYRLDRTGELAHWWVRSVDPDELDLAGLGQPSSLPDDHPPVAVLSTSADLVVLDVTGIRLEFRIHRVGHLSYVDSPEGSVVLAELDRYPPPPPPVDGTVIAPIGGQIASVHVMAGQRVAAGELLVTLEAMARQHAVHAPAAGVVTTLAVRPGTTVEGGALLGVLAPD